MNDKTDDLLESRRAVYGDRIQNMVEVAQLLTGLGFQHRGKDIQPWQVPVIFGQYKMHRLMNTPDYSDNIDDVDGWLAMFREVMGDDLIEARTVEEFLAKKEARKNQVWCGASIYNATQGKRYYCSHAKHTFDVVHQFDVPEEIRIGPKHPYENVERDAEAEMVSTFVANRHEINGD